MLTSTGMNKQWDAWDAELVHLGDALTGDASQPPTQTRAVPLAGPSAPRSLPLPNAGQLGVMRPPLTPELVVQLEAATAETVDGKAPPLPIQPAPEPAPEQELPEPDKSAKRPPWRMI